MSQLRRGAILLSVLYILLLTSGFACTEPVWSTPCIWPGTVTQPNPVDINHMNPEELSEYETILNTIKLIHVACFNEEVYEIIHNIKTDDARDLIVAFYVYKDHDFHYVGSFGANRKIFKTEIINHNHYFVRNFYHLYIGNGRSWIIDKLIMIPHVKADIIQFCDDINCKCEIDDFDDISTETRMNVDGTGINVSNVGFKSKDKAVCEALIANKGISANNADSLIKVKENSSSSKINQICSENKLFKLPCICNNPNTYTDPCVNRFLKPCAYPSLKNYQNVCPCTKLSNLLELKPCKFISNLCPFLCKNPVPSLSIDKPRFKPITEQICPLNSLQKVCPSPQFSKWYNPYLYYATHDTKPNTNGNLYLREDSTNTEKSNELYNNAKININQMDGNDKKYPTNKILSDQDASINADKKIVGNTTPNGEATATCYAQSNVKDSKFAVLSSQTQSLDSNENNEVICTGQLKPTNNQNPFRISIENGVDKLQLGSNTLLENGQKLNEQQEFPINVNQTPLPKIGANSLLTKLLVDKIPKRLDSSVTNVYPRNKLTYLQSPDLTTINEIQKIPIDETNTNIFITNNNSNIGTAMADINKQASEFSQPNYNREIFEDIGTRFTNKKPEPLAKQSPEIVPTVMKNEIKYSDNVMLNIAPNSHRDTKLDEELPKSISERKYEKTPIGSNMNLFPEPIEILTLPNNKQNLYSPGTSVAQGYNTNDHRIQIDNPHNIYAVNNNQIQSTQNKTPIFSFSLPKEQIAVHPLTSYQSKLHVPAPNTDMGVQLNNDYMNPKATTTFAKLSDYEIPNNGERIQLNNAQNVYATNNDKLQTKLNNAPREVLSSSLPNKQIVVNAPICYQLKPSVATLNKDKGVLQLYNGNINPKATIFAKLPQYKILNNEIDENENLNIQSTAPLTGGVFLTPNHIKDNNDQIQLNNPRNVFAINNKIQSTQNNIPNEILSFPLPTEQVRNNPLTYHESKLKLQKPSSDMKVLQLHNQYTNPLATITFKIPNNQIDEKDNPNAQSIDTLTGNSLVTPDYKTDNNYRIQLNNPQNIYAGNDNKIQNTQTYLPNEVYSYFLPKKQISVNPPIRYESKLNLPIPSTAMGALQFNNDYMNPKAPTTFAKLQGYEIPNNEIGEKDKTNVQSTPDTLTGGLFVTPDYKTDNNYRIRFNNPQNVNAVNDKKIQSTQNNIPNELLSYPLPNKQIAVKATISYQPQLNVHIPNTDEGVLQLSNEDMNPIAITTFTKLLDYEILNNQIDKNEKSTEQDVSALTGSVLTTPDYKTTNGDRIELSNPQNIYTVNNNKIQSTQNNIPNGFLSYSLPEDQFPANQLISHNSKLNPLSPYINTKVLELNNKNMYPKASITYTKLPELELSNKKINKNLNSIAQSIDTFTGGNNPQNVYAVNNIKIQSVQNNKPNEVFSYSLPNEQTAVNPLNYESKSNLLTPNINVKVLPSKNEHLNLKAITTSEISNNQIVEKENPNVQSTNTISSNVPGTPCYKTNNDNNIQLNNPRNVYAVDNNNIQSTPNEVFSYVLPKEQNIVNSPIIYQSKLNVPAPNINMGVLQSNNDDMNPKATVMFTKLQENKITNNQIYENENQIVQGFQILTGHVQAKPDYKTNNGDKTEISIPQNICTINDEKTQSAQNNIPNEVLSYSLPEEKNLVNPSFNYNSKLNLPTPHTNLKILKLRTNPKSSTRFTELPEYNKEIDENVNSIAQDIDTCTDRLLLTPGYKTELNNPHNVYAAYNNIQSVQNNKPDEVSSYSLPNEQLVGNPLIYEPKLNLPTPNTEKGVVQLNDGDMNPKTPITFAKLPEYEITNNQIGEKENPNLQSIDNLTGDGLISPGFTTGDSDNIQLNNPKNVFAIYNNNIPNTPNNVPYAVCPLFLKKEKITMNPSINYESKLNQPTSILLQPNNDHINPKARTIFAKLPKYEIPYENKNTIAQEIKTVTGGVLVTPDFKTNYDDIKQLNYPQNIYAVNNNKIQSIQPCNVLPYFLPKENNAVNSLISYQSKLNLPIPNILKLNNKSFNTNTNEPSVVNPFSYESKYEIPYSEIDENGKPNAQSMDNLTDGFLVMPDYKTVNNDRIQLYHPQNICTIDNDKIQNTQNNKPNEILSYSSPNEQVLGDSSNHYQSKIILPTSDTNMKILHLNNAYINPEATVTMDKLPEYEKPNNQIDKKENLNVLIKDTLTGIGPMTLDYKTNNNDRIQLNNPQTVYPVNNDLITQDIPKYHGTQNVPNKVSSYSLPKEQIAINPSINYPSILNLPTLNTNMKILDLNNDYINPKATTSFAKLPDYELLNKGDRILLNHPKNVYVINNNIQSTENSTPTEFWSNSLSNEQIAVEAPISYQQQLNVSTPNTGNGVLQLSDEDINPRSTITFSKLPDYKILNNGYRIQHDNPQNVYAINNNKMQSAQNNIPEEFLSYSLPNEEIVGIPQNRYQSKLNVQTQNTGKGVLELNTENPKATITFAKLAKFEIPINQINGNENSIEQSKDTQTDSISVKPEYKTNDSAKIQLYNPQNVCVLNNNKLQSPQNNNPNEVWSYSLPKQQTASNPQSLSVVNDYKISNTQNSTPYKMFSYFSPKEEIAVKFPIGYESKLNLPTPNTDSRQLQLNNVNMNPTVTSKLPDYETLNNSGRVQLDNPQNVYALNNNKIRNTLFNTPSEILTSSLPNEQIVVNVPSSYQSQPNVHLLNIDKGVYNGEINPKAAAAFAKLSDFEIPYNGDRIQFNSPQNVYAILNNKIQNTFNNMPSEVLSSSLPNEEIVVNAPFSYQSQPNVPIPNTDQGVLQLNNEDKIPNTDTLIGGLIVTPDYMSNNNDRIQLNNPQYAYSVINNKLQSRQDYIPNKMLSYSLPKKQIAINPHISDQSILNLPTPNTNMKVLHLNNDYMNPKATTTFARLPDYEIPSNGDRIQLYNPQSVYAISNDKMQSTPSKVLSYSLPNEQMAAEAPISDQPQLNIPTPNTDKEVQQLNNRDIIPKTTITFAKLPEYVIPNKQIHKKDNLNILSTDTLTGGIFVTPGYKTDNNDRIQLSNPQNVYAVNDNKIQSAQNYLPNEALSYSVPNKQIATEDPICYQPQLSLPTPNTDKGVLQFNKGYINSKATITSAEFPEYEIPKKQIDRKENPNAQSIDSNDRIQLSNPLNVYAVKDNKIQSAQNNIPNDALSYSLPNEQIAVKASISYQPDLNVPIPNTDKGVLELNNGDMNPLATTTFAKLPDYEIVNNQIDEKETLNKQKLDLIGGFLNVNRVFNPQKVETGIYRPMRICSEPNYYTSKLNPSATYTNPEEINRHTLVYMKPEKYFVPNYSNSIDYTSIISGQTNGIVTPKETGDELKMYQEIYTPKELTQYEVPQQVSYKNSGSNNVPKAKYIELNSSLPKYNKLDTNDKLYEAAPEFALNGENNHNLLNPAMYDEKTIKVQESTFIPLGMNADAYVTNEVEENKYLPYFHQKNDLGEDSKYIDIFNKHYTMNVDVINKDKNNNRPEYTILDQAELCNPRINIAVNDNQLFLPSEKISYQDQPSIEPLSPFNISVRGEGNVYNIQDNEYLNLPVAQKLRQVNQYPDNSETNSEIVYDVGLKKSNEACMPLYVGSDLQQYRIVNNINENQNIEIFDIKPAGIINLKGADKGIKGPNSLVTETLNKPAFINYELADTKTNSSPEKYQIKYPELGLQNNAEEKPCKSTVFNMPITEKTINDDFTKSIATPLETSPTDILNIRTDPDKISKQATKYYNENYSPIEQTQNIITGIYKDTESPVYSNLVLDEIQPDLSVVGKGKVEQIKDINNAQIFDSYKMPTPVAHDIHKILIDGYNTSDNTKLHICNPKDEKETPIEGKYESYVIHNTNYKSNYSQPGQPGTEIYSTFRRTDGNIGISNSESNEVLNEVTPLPRSQSTVNYLSTSDQPVKIEAIKCTDVNTLTPQVELNVQQRYMYPQMPTYHQNANSVEEEIQYTATIQGAINDKPDIYPLSYNKPVPVETENNIFQDYDSKINDKSIYMDTVTLSVGAKAKEQNKQENVYDIYTGYLNDIPKINEGISLAYPSLTQPSENNAFNDNMNLNFGYHVTPEEATANEYQVTGQIIDELNVHQLSSLYTINNERPTHWYESIKNKNLNVCQDFSKIYQVYEEKPHDFTSLAINSGPGKYYSNNLEPTFLTLNHQPSQSIININPTLEKFTPLNEIKYDESNSYPIPSSSDFKNSLSDNTIPSVAEMLPNSLNSLGIPLQGLNLLPQNQWYYSSSSSRQSVPTFITFKNNLNPCLSQNLNQPPLDSSQIQSTALSVLKNNLLNYLKSNDNIVNTTSINIPLGDLGVAKYEPIDNIKHFTINTENNDINLKAWYSKLKLIKAKITFETTEASALNFIPVVNNKSKYCPVKVQEIAKNAISKVYGDPIVIKGVYSFDEPYVIVDNVDSACIYNGGYIFLWPTFCDCGCQKAGCQCWLQNLNNSC